MRERVGLRVDLFFMSIEVRERIKTRVGLFSGPGGPFFMSIEMRERVGSGEFPLPSSMFFNDFRNTK